MAQTNGPDDITISVSSLDDVRCAIDWSRVEEWNPALNDLYAFHSAGEKLSNALSGTHH